MRIFRKCTLLVVILAVMLCGCAFGGEKRIGEDAALQIALTDADLTRDQVTDIDVDLEQNFRSASYEISFECGRVEYEYEVDAYSGDILYSKAD